MWLIQDKIFGEETDDLLKHIDDYQLVSGIPDEVPYDTVVRGSVDFVELYQNKFPENKQWLTLQNYNCDYYYPFVDNLLNKDYLMMSWGSLLEKKEVIFSKFSSDSIFIRPNSGRKIFTGTTLTKKWWDKELDIIRELPNSSIDDNDLVLVSSAKEIKAEYRFLMRENLIIGKSLYEGDSSLAEDIVTTSVAMGNKYFPDEYYTLDIAVTKIGQVCILEFNSFVSAGLYDMDYSSIASFFKGQ